jgi:beta-N-acetylhexosaminidase
VAPIELLAEHVLLPGFDGLEAPEWVLRHAARGLGGVCIFARNIESPAQLARLCASLHEANPRLIIAIDEEGGDVTRLEAATGSSYPGNLALGAAGDLDLTRRIARSIGLELAHAGIDLDLAPAADVNSNPANPIIGVRSFGSETTAVAQQTAAWVEGMQSAGVGACAKHFPGHGDTSVDSHRGLPVCGADPREGALLPFEAAIAAGARAVMSGHVVATALDSVPATASRAVMTDLLRGELGFAGMTVSDGLEMNALTAAGGLEQGAVRAMNAGCDLLCVGGGLKDEATVTRLARALASGVPAQRLAEAAARIDAFATWRASQSIPAESPERSVGLRAARLAIRADGDVRIRSDATVVKLDPEPSIAAGVIPWGVEQALTDRGVRVREADCPEDHSLVITVRDLHRQGWQAEEVARLLARRPDAVVVEMGAPYCRPNGARKYIATMGAARVCAVAAAEVMRP